MQRIADAALATGHTLTRLAEMMGLTRVTVDNVEESDGEFRARIRGVLQAPLNRITMESVIVLPTTQQDEDGTNG